MLNKVAKLALVATSLAPIFLTLWFVEFSKAWNWQAGWQYLLAAVLLSLLCAGLIWLSGKNLEKLPVRIKSVKTGIRKYRNQNPLHRIIKAYQRQYAVFIKLMMAGYFWLNVVLKTNRAMWQFT